MEIFPTSAITTLISGITGTIRDNAAFILGVIAFVIGVSIVMAWIDIRNEDKWLDNYSKRWKR